MPDNVSFEICRELHDSHLDLSRAALAWLEHARAHPECLDAASLPLREAEGDVLDHPFQPWPTLVARDRLREIVAPVLSLCKLMRALPGRVFADDPGGLADFYGLEARQAETLALTFKDPARTAGALARPDLLRSADGWHCLELNLGGAIGGWETSYRAASYRRAPAIAGFLEAHGLELECPRVLRRLLAHVVGETLRQLRSRTCRVVFLLPSSVEIGDRLETLLGEEMRAIVAGLAGAAGGSRVEGSVRVLQDDAELEGVGGELHLRGERIHAMVETSTVSASIAAWRAWLNGRVLLYNGLVAPLLTDKRNLALASELAASDLFDDGERATLRKVVPWTRRVSTRGAGRHPPSEVTFELLRAERRHLVLKPGGGLGGSGVVFGPGCSEAEWARALERAFEEGTWVAQERVEPRPLLYLDAGGSPRPHDVVWGFFVFGDLYGGGFVRMAPRGGGVVNASAGATIAPLFEIDEPAAVRSAS